MSYKKRLLCTVAVALSFTACAANATVLPLIVTTPSYVNSADWYTSSGWSDGTSWNACQWEQSAVSVNNNTNLLFTLSNGGSMTSPSPYACPEIQSTSNYGYGMYTATMKTAAGSGLNTAFFTYAGPPSGTVHDEIDMEFLGSNPNTVDLTFYSNGVEYGAVQVPLGFNASQAFHTYKIAWTPTSIKWYADSALIYTSPKGAAIPVTPGKVLLSLWAGTSALNAWLGPFT